MAVYVSLDDRPDERLISIQTTFETSHPDDPRDNRLDPDDRDNRPDDRRDN
jgi:hypothetical protein